MTETALYTTHAPAISVGGTERGELARDLLRLDIEESTEGLRTMVCRLHAIGPTSNAGDGDLQYLDGSVIDFGSAITVDFGPPGDTHKIFDGTVSAIELCLEDGGSAHVAIYAEDALMGLRMTRRSKTYEQSSDADVVAAVAREHGLGSSADAPGPTYPVVQQWNQSDLAFLRDRAAMVQAELWADGSTIHFATRSNRTAPAVTLVHGNGLLSASIRADVAHQRTAVTVSGYDFDTHETVEHEAGDSVIKREISGGTTGIDVLAKVFDSAVTMRTRDAPVNADEAKSWAEAEMLRRARGFVTVEGLTAGTAQLTVGSKLKLERAGVPFSGEGYYTTWVHHSYDRATGPRTRFMAERATVSS